MEFQLNLTALKRRAYRTAKLFLVLSTVLGILFWILNPINANNITHYMITEGIPRWMDHSIMNLMWCWVLVAMLEGRSNSR